MHEEKGFVPCLRYSAIISSCWRCLEAGSFFPLYLACSAWSSGCMSCMPRLARICLTNSGIIRMRTKTVRPIIDSTQATPGASGFPIPMSTRNLWM